MEQTQRTDKWSRYVFWGLLVVFAGIYALVAPKIGCTDEWRDGINGKYALKYYMESDTTFLDFPQYSQEEHMPYTMKYYGMGVEIIPPLIAEFIPAAEKYEYEIRHWLCAFSTLLLILFCGLIGKYLKDCKLGG